ncbi:MAG: hypothetical protein GXO26_00180 [Crenarchaeota archaeon]|nr:hypothetical protein [Thermoproteota archaeon]
MSERDLKLDMLRMLFAPTLFAIGIIPAIFLLIMVKFSLSRYVLRLLWASCATLIYVTFLVSFLAFERRVRERYMHVENARKMLNIGRRGIIIFSIAVAALWILVALSY